MPLRRPFFCNNPQFTKKLIEANLRENCLGKQKNGHIFVKFICFRTEIKARVLIGLVTTLL